MIFSCCENFLSEYHFWIGVLISRLPLRDNTPQELRQLEEESVGNGKEQAQHEP